MSEVAVAEYVDLDRASLAEVEEFIAPRLRGFVEVGVALIAIRERRLYLDAGWDRFEDYCVARWEMSRSRAYELCDAAQVRELTASTASTLAEPVEPVANEWQARQLAPLLDNPDELRAVWREVNERGKPTATLIREVIRDRRKQAAPQPAPQPRPRVEPQPFPASAHRAFMLLTQAAEEVQALGGAQVVRDAYGQLDPDIRRLWQDRLTAVGQLIGSMVVALSGQ